MSDSTQVVVDVEAGPDDAPRLAALVREWLASEGVVAPAPPGAGQGDPPGARWARATSGGDGMFPDVEPNTVELIAERRVFDAGENGIELRCAACGESLEPGDAWIDAVGAWAEGDDSASFACPRCGAAAPLREWRGPWAWGFGCLAVRFWNWPELSDRFVRELAEKLGHRVVVVRSRV